MCQCVPREFKLFCFATLNLKLAKEASQELQELKTEVKIAREQLEVADDATQARLDLDAYLSAQGLGERNAFDPVEQIGELAAVSAYVGLNFEIPFSNSERNARSAQAALILSAAQERYMARSQQIEAEAAKQVDKL